MTLAGINDELGAARTNKKDFLDKLEGINSVGRIYRNNKAKLLQRRTWKQTIPTGINAENIHTAERV